jgi:hypothetical protein
MANETERKLSFLVKGNTSPFILIALSFCLVLSIPFVTFLLIQTWGAPSYDENGTQAGLSLDEYELIARLGLFSAVLCFGALGSAISLISRARHGPETFPDITPRELLSVQTVGAVFALILSLMFMGDLVAGTMFPNWDPFYRIIYSPPAFAKLLVWSFIAGFIERLVPNVLHNLATRAERERSRDI